MNVMKGGALQIQDKVKVIKDGRDEDGCFGNAALYYIKWQKVDVQHTHGDSRFKFCAWEWTFLK